ncbi:MAG: MFS transporter [Candidatus Thermoplasmatota archaeon]|nr:MFS transporter [Candidatus Thermoplasmatota archaeon]
MDEENKVHDIYYGWFIVSAAFVALLVLSIRSYGFGVFIDPLTADFGWARAPLTLVFSISLLVTSLFGILSGRLSDTYGVKKVMAAGTILVSAGFLLSSQIQNLYHLYMTYFIIGVGASTIYIPAATTVTRWFDKKRGLAVGISVAAIAIGMASFPPILERSINAFGWRSTFILVGVFALIALSFSTILMKRSPRSGEGKEDDSRDEKSYTLKEALKTRYFWIIYFMFLMAQFSAMTITVHIVPYSTDVGLSSFYAAATLTAVGLANIFGRVLGGWTSDKLGVIKGVAIFFVFQSLAIFTLPFFSSLFAIYAVALLFGLAYGGWVMIYPVITSRLFGTKNSGAILGALGTVAGVGGALGPYVAGYLYDLTGLYDLAFLISGFLMLGAFCLALLFIWTYDE